MIVKLDNVWYNIKMMKIIMVIFLTFLVGCTSVPEEIVIPKITQEPTPTPTRIITVGSVYPADSPVGVFLESFALNLMILLEGDVEVVVYHDAFLGDNQRHEELLLSGGVDFAVVSINDDDPLSAILNTPFAVNDNNIDDVIAMLDSENPAESLNLIHCYLNCGSMGIESTVRYASMQSMIPLDKLDEEIQEDWLITNINSNEFTNRYFANIDYVYDIGVFCESKNSGMMFDEHQTVQLAVTRAKISMDATEQRETPSDLVMYRPSDYDEYINTLPPVATRLPQGEEFDSTMQLFDEIF